MAHMERSPGQAPRRSPAGPHGSGLRGIGTGREALGRGNALQKLQLFMQQISGPPFPPSAAKRYIKPNVLLARIATALSLDIKGLIKTEEEISGEVQQEQARSPSFNSMPVKP